MRQQTGASLTLFYSYAHEDESFREQLEKHLRLLKRQSLISEWHDRLIDAGTEWAKQIDEHLETASVILLLISPDFLASDYCYEIEMQCALERHARGVACVIPVILRPCEWHEAPFAHIQVLPRDGKPVTEWDNLDAAFLNVTQGIRRAIGRQTPPARSLLPLSSVDRQNRLRLLKRVRQTWIEGVLEQSLHQAALIALDLQDQPDALDNPWHLEVQETNLPPRPLPAGTSIVQVYDGADGELLILGEPGAGKTTLLLELARTLMHRAEQNEQERIPVVFHLSSWARKRQPLVDWLVEELKAKYQISQQIGKAWINDDQILPLLDGLDEVAKQARQECMQAINAYHQQRLLEKGTAPLVVCCRSQDYRALLTHATLQQAASIQQLTNEQIELYLQSAKGQLDGLRYALHHDPDLYELVRRPLLLNVFTLAYQGADPEEFPAERSHEALEHSVFATYVKRMLSRREFTSRIPREDLLQGLVKVAVWMKRENRSELDPLLAPIRAILLPVLSRTLVRIMKQQSVWLVLTEIPDALRLGFLVTPLGRRNWYTHEGLPSKIEDILDEATERVLLRKVGGSYIFVHRLLLDYFADLEKQDP
jgi:DNA polymerase III delta prime subunit